MRIREYANKLTVGFEEIYFNAWNSFRLQYPTLLAPLRFDDKPEVAERKLRIVARYIDILIARHIWNKGHSPRYNDMQYSMFNVIKLIRRQSPDETANLLHNRLDNPGEDFQENDFGLHGRNRWKIRYMLARMTWHIETEASTRGAPAMTDFLDGKKYDIEHIWADKYNRHKAEFDHEYAFQRHRNRIGGLLLLSRDVNRSLKDATYTAKITAYRGENLLAASLHEDTYKNAPSLSRFNDRLARETGHSLRAHYEFKKGRPGRPAGALPRPRQADLEPGKVA